MDITPRKRERIVTPNEYTPMTQRDIAKECCRYTNDRRREKSCETTEETTSDSAYDEKITKLGKEIPSLERRRLEKGVISDEKHSHQ
ncbi:hypothetical protein J6590_000125 [Homalodisca vitripennis]|nr:hypothetical protein J6590_098872 [Homalodisca vitripennis]KAG8338459.1 hypothetical protein J6590_000125 [Homalodisca vitripennis]